MAKKADKSELESLKLRYKELQDKYDLPNFEEFNREFYIEKIAETETEILTREIRRFIADKIFNYIRFVETLLNPVNAPMFIFSVIKSLTEDDKKKLSEIYDKLSEIDIELIKLDIDTSEKKDVEFLRKAYDSWQIIKRELIEILKKLKSEKNKKENETSGKYFG